MTSHPDEGTLHAFIDGELSAGDAAALEAHVAGCQTCGIALAEARGFVAGASRAISALDVAPSSASRPVLARPDAQPSRHLGTRPFVFRVPFARAAALLLLAGGTAVVVSQSGTEGTETGLGLESVAVDLAMPTESAAAAAPIAAAPAPAVSPMAAPASADLSASRVAEGIGAAVGKAAAPHRAGAVSVGTSASGVVEPRDVAVTGQVGNISSVEAARPRSAAPVISSPASMAAPVGAPTDATPSAPPSRAAVTAESDFSGRGVVGTARVSRFRTKEGVVLTLTDEPLRTSFAEERSVARQRAMPSAATMSAAPDVNTYRWSNEEQGRTYTLTGSLTVAELEAAARRLTELERVN